MAASSAQPARQLSTSAHSEYELPAFSPGGLADAAAALRVYRSSRRRYLFLAKNGLSFCSFLALFVLFTSLAANTCIFSVVFAFLLLASMARGKHALLLLFSAAIVAIQTAYALLYTVRAAPLPEA